MVNFSAPATRARRRHLLCRTIPLRQIALVTILLQTGTVSIVLDHFFVLTKPGAPAVSRLLELGFIEGSSNSHPGQGTANRRIFLEDGCLELLFLRDIAEARSGPGAELHLADRASDAEASPYGLVFRRNGEGEFMPFPGWRYVPDYFGPGLAFHVGSNSGSLVEPLCIVMPAGLPRPVMANEPRNPQWALSEVRIDTPAEPGSTVLKRVIANCDCLSIRYGRPHNMTLVFNAGGTGNIAILRPELPLEIRW